jgi:molybdate transport system regulatory protein
MLPRSLNLAVFLEREGPGGAYRVGAQRIALIEAVDALGAISAAARALGLSYKAAWDGVQALNNLSDAPIIVATPGGRTGGAARVTAQGRLMAQAFRGVQQQLEAAAAQLDLGLAAGEARDLFWSLGMRTSARNALRGEIVSLTDGAVNAEVGLKLVDDVTLTAIITRQSLEDLGLKVGQPAIALIDSTAIILAVGEARTSARNRLPGVVTRRDDGAVNSEISIDIGGGKTLAVTVTSISAAELQLYPGTKVTALIKAPHIILAVE